MKRKTKEPTPAKAPNYKVVPRGDGTYYVADLNAPRGTHGVSIAASGFDTKQEAEQWIEDQ